MKTYKTPDFKNIKNMLEVRTISHHDKIAFYQKNNNKEFDAITYGQLKRDVDALGTALLEMGLKNKKIAIIGKNRYEWAVAYLASICGVGVVVPLDKQLADNEIKNCLDRVDIEALIYSNEFEERLKDLASEVNVKHYISMDQGELSISGLINRGKKLIEEGNRNYIDAEINENELASLLFTSGTTSQSKIVMLSHKNIMANVKAGQMMVHIDESDTLFSVLPLNHTLECTCALIYPLASGASIAYSDNFANLQKDLKVIKPTTMLIVPRIAEILHDKIVTGIEKKNKVKMVKITVKLTNMLGRYKMAVKRKVFHEIHEEFGGNLRLIVMGGAPINPNISKYFRDLGILAFQGYGLTECAPLVTLNSDTYFKDDSAGLPMPGSDVRIDCPNEEGVGEVIVKGPQVMLGYYNNEKATNEAIKDGYLHTGDLGKFNHDGFLKIMGRIKNVIVSSNGKNIYPEEIEALLNEHDTIKGSMVYEEENKRRGHLIAEVVLIDEIRNRIKAHPEYEAEIRKTLTDYLALVNTKLSEYKRVHSLVIRQTDFDMTSTLKIKRFSSRPQEQRQ